MQRLLSNSCVYHYCNIYIAWENTVCNEASVTPRMPKYRHKVRLNGMCRANRKPRGLMITVYVFLIDAVLLAVVHIVELHAVSWCNWGQGLILRHWENKGNRQRAQPQAVSGLNIIYSSPDWWRQFQSCRRSRPQHHYYFFKPIKAMASTLSPNLPRSRSSVNIKDDSAGFQVRIVLTLHWLPHQHSYVFISPSKCSSTQILLLRS